LNEVITYLLYSIYVKNLTIKHNKFYGA
jgi:hypothetical protein